MSCGLGQEVRVFDLRMDGDCLHVLRGHQDWVRGVACVGNYALSVGKDHTARVWDLARGAQVRIAPDGRVAHLHQPLDPFAAHPPLRCRSLTCQSHGKTMTGRHLLWSSGRWRRTIGLPTWHAPMELCGCSASSPLQSPPS